MSEKRFPFAVEMVLTGWHFLCNSSSKLHDGGRCPKRSMLLYALHLHEENFILLNRDYKPLGISFYDPYVEYSDYPFLHIPKEMVNTKDLITHSHDPKLFWFFSDLSYPDRKKSRDLYGEKLVSVFGGHFIGFKEDIINIKSMNPGRSRYKIYR